MNIKFPGFKNRSRWLQLADSFYMRKLTLRSFDQVFNSNDIDDEEDDADFIWDNYAVLLPQIIGAFK